MLKDTIIALLIGFATTAILCPIMIPILHRFKFGQQIRKEGPQNHLKKRGTPTMGGIMIITGIVIACLIFINKYPLILPILLFTVFYGIIGFFDDFLKIYRHKSDGLRAIHKLALQIICTSVLVYYMHQNGIAQESLIPFTGGMDKGILLNIGWLWIPAAYIVVLGTDNGVNFTDGLDGLCASVTIAVSMFFMAASIKEWIMVAPIAGATIGSLLGFMIYNVQPAKVFMGDTGSLALGGYVASLALIMKMPLFIAIVGFIYLIEVLSVIIQVGYFKSTGGKRFFKMAPIHHHFELCNWSETRVVAVFTIITVIIGLLAYLGLSI